MVSQSDSYIDRLEALVKANETTAIQAEIARIEHEAHKEGVSTASQRYHALLRPLYEKLNPDPVYSKFAGGPESGN